MKNTGHADTAHRFLEHAAAGRAVAESSKLVTKDFRHHNAYFKGDAASLFEAMDANARQFPDKQLDVFLTLEDGSTVATYSKVMHKPGSPAAAVVHIFRFEDDRIAELWDIGQEIPADSPNENGAF